MKINWKRIVIAGIWAEALLLLIRIPITKYIVPTPIFVGIILWFVPMFLGGLWVAQKIESRFILHGALVGIVANIVFIPMTMLFSLIQLEPTAVESEPINKLLMSIILLVSILVKIFGSAIGAYVGVIIRRSRL